MQWYCGLHQVSLLSGGISVEFKIWILHQKQDMLCLQRSSLHLCKSPCFLQLLKCNDMHGRLQSRLFWQPGAKANQGGKGGGGGGLQA